MGVVVVECSVIFGFRRNLATCQNSSLWYSSVRKDIFWFSRVLSKIPGMVMMCQKWIGGHSPLDRDFLIGFDSHMHRFFVQTITFSRTANDLRIIVEQIIMNQL